MPIAPNPIRNKCATSEKLIAHASECFLILSPSIAENRQVERHARADSVGNLPPPGEAEPGQGRLDENGLGHAAASVALVSSVGSEPCAAARSSLVTVPTVGPTGSTRALRIVTAAAELHGFGR